MKLYFALKLLRALPSLRKIPSMWNWCRYLFSGISRLLLLSSHYTTKTEMIGSRADFSFAARSHNVA